MKQAAMIVLVIFLICLPSYAYDESDGVLFDEVIYCSECMEQIDVLDIAYMNDQWIICNNCQDLYFVCPECGQLFPRWYIE